MGCQFSLLFHTCLASGNNDRGRDVLSQNSTRFGFSTVVPQYPDRSPSGHGDVNSRMSAAVEAAMSVPGKTESWKRSTNGKEFGISVWLEDMVTGRNQEVDLRFRRISLS